MNVFDILKQEHLDIERELFELEEIMQVDEINYPNLVHVLRRLTDIWDVHEKREVDVFSVLRHARISMPVKTMLFEHGALKPHREKIVAGIKEGNEEKLKNVLKKDGQFIIDKLREHIGKEDEVLYRLTLDLFSAEELGRLAGE